MNISDFRSSHFVCLPKLDPFTSHLTCCVQRYPHSESLGADPDTGHVGPSRNGFYLEFPERRELILNLNQAFPILQRRRWRPLRLQAVLTVCIKLWGVGWCSRAERATELYGVHVKRVDPQTAHNLPQQEPGAAGNPSLMQGD